MHSNLQGMNIAIIQFQLLFMIILQGGDSLEPSNYRPITIPSNLLRLITVRMAKSMAALAEEHGMLGPEQFGFRRGRHLGCCVCAPDTSHESQVKTLTLCCFLH